MKMNGKKLLSFVLVAALALSLAVAAIWTQPAQAATATLPDDLQALKTEGDAEVQLGKDVTAAEPALNAAIAAGNGERVTAYCPVCKVDVTWKPLSEQTPNGADAANESGYLSINYSSAASTARNKENHWYVDDATAESIGADFVPPYYNYTTSEGTAKSGYRALFSCPATNKTGCLYLNRKTISNTKKYVFSGSAGIMNVIGHGATVTGYTTSATEGAVARINTSGRKGAVNLFGGTYTKHASASSGKGNIFAVGGNGGEISIYDGVSVTCGTGGGLLYLDGGINYKEAVFNMYGGIMDASEASDYAIEIEVGYAMTRKGGSKQNTPTDMGDTVAFNMYDGAIYGGDNSLVIMLKDQQSSAATYGTRNCQFNMFGGKLTSKPVAEGETLARGRRVWMKGPYNDFNLCGGTIENGLSTSNGGNIRCEGGQIKMYSGTITGGEVRGSGLNGGNIAVSSGTFTMYGGTVSDGVALYDTDGTTKVTNSSAPNIYLSGSTASISGGVVSGGLSNSSTGGGSIYMTGSKANDSIANDTSLYSVLNLSGDAVIEGGKNLKTGGGNICAYRGVITVSENAVIRNGFGSKEGGGNVILKMYSTLTLKDNAEISGGIITGSDAVGGNICAGKDASVYIQGGTVKDGNAGGEGVENITVGTNCYGGNIYSYNLEISGGTVSGGKSQTSGGNIYNADTLTISGGTITGGMAATQGGNIYTVGTVNATDGDILNGTAGTNGGNIRIAGGEVTLGEGVLVDGGTANVTGKTGQGGGNIYLRDNGVKLTTAATITNGKTTGANAAGGNINVGSNATLNITGGVIAHGRVEGTEGDSWGGNIRCYGDETTTVNISGGLIYDGTTNGPNAPSFGISYKENVTISGGTIVNGLSLSKTLTSLKISGAPKILRSMTIDGTTYTGAVLNIGEGTTADISELSKDAELWVTGAKNAALTVASDNAKDVQDCIISGNAAYCVTLKEDNILYYTAHAKTSVAKADATCTEVGYTDNYKYCAVCGDYYNTAHTARLEESDVVIPAKGHTPGTPVQENVVNATLNAPGSYDEVVYCSVCDEELSRTEKEIAQLTGAKASINGWFYATLEEAAADVKDGETIVLLADATVSNPVVILTASLDLNGFVLTGDVAGTVLVNGGGIVADDQPFIGDGDYAYLTTDAVLMILPEDITVVSGTVTVVATLPGLPSAKLTIAEAANLVIAQGVTLNVHGNLIANGNITNNGTIALIRTGATVQTAQTLEVIATVGDKVLYKDGVYAVHTHNVAIDQAVAPTCTATGLTEGKHCDVCDEVLVAQAPVDALGHEEEVVPGKAPTCTKTGLTEGTKCSVCNEVIVAQEEIAALGHDYENGTIVSTYSGTCIYQSSVTKKCANCNWTQIFYGETNSEVHMNTEVLDAVAPDCTSTGLTEGLYCNDCKTTVTAQEEIAALGHKEEVVAGYAATCTETGLTDGKKCSVCNEVIVAQEEIAALGHSIVLLTEGVPANCLKPGTAAVYTCTVCGAYFEDAEGKSEQDSETPGMIFPDGHELTFVAGKAATCTETGIKEHYLCTVCGCTYAEDNMFASEAIDIVIPMAGHTEGEAVEENRVEATLNAPGSYDVVVYCAVCNEEMSRETKEIEQLTGAKAHINGYYYATFAEALAEVKEGETITLLAPIVVAKGETLELNLNGFDVVYVSDVMGEAMITNNGTLTVTGNGKLSYTYTGAADTAYTKGNYTIANNGKLTVDGATIENATAKLSHASYAITNGNGGQIVLESGLIVNETNYAVRMFGNGSLTVNGGEIRGTRAVWMQAPGSNTADAPTIALTVNGGKLTGTGESADYKLAVYSYSYGNSMKNISITVTDGEIDGDIALGGGKNKTEAETVTVTGGKLTDLYSYAEDEVAGKTVNISGGTFDVEVYEAYCAEGYMPAENSDGTYGVTEDKNVAKIGDVKYATVAAALKAAKAGETVVVYADSDESKTILVMRNGAALDLNGHTLKANYLITANGSSNIFDSTGEGLLLVAKDNLTIVNPTCLPVWDAEVNGYRFVKVEMDIYEVKKSEESLELQYWFLGAFDGAMKQHLAKVEENGLKVVLRVNYKNAEGYDAILDIVVPDEIVIEYAGIDFEPYFTTTIRGLRASSDAVITTYVTYGDVEIKGTTYSYNAVTE